MNGENVLKIQYVLNGNGYNKFMYTEVRNLGVNMINVVTYSI